MKTTFDASPAEEAEDWSNVDNETARAALQTCCVGDGHVGDGGGRVSDGDDHVVDGGGHVGDGGGHVHMVVMVVLFLATMALL